METLWAPWRMTYIKKAGNGDCFFCAYLSQKRDPRNLILHRGRTCLIILNRFPYNTGHLMVAPQRHKGTFAEIDDEETLELFRLTRWSQEILDRTLKPHGYNIGINLGRIAGAGVLDHLHVHVVPRWAGDTNFMPVIGGTKVMPMALGELYRRLKRAMKNHAPNADVY